MLSHFFINRPVFATVAALFMVLIGAIAIPSIPISQYPPIAPPKVTVAAMYNGASSEVVESAVTTPLEQAINGVERMRYLQSISTADGLSSITVTFEQGTDLDQAVVNVQNRVNSAEGRLPPEVRSTGINVEKSSDAIVLGIGFFSESNTYDDLYISNYIDRYVIDALKRINGVAKIQLYGERKYAMRLWLDPLKMAAQSLSAMDITTALRAQNVEVPAGQIGLAPVPGKQDFQMSILVKGRLANAEEFDNIIVKKGAMGSVVRLKDVGRAELGAEDYSKGAWWHESAAVGFSVAQLPDANALQVATDVRDKLIELSANYPEGLDYQVAFDATTFVDESMNEVFWTLVQAIGFVVLVIWLFLQQWKTTLIPAITIPVSLIGSFIFIKLFGYSINMLTLFGITLATGLVVDDAIVVVENIARYVEEKGYTPAEAAKAAMDEIFGAVIATSLVLLAVFVPVAFFPGTTGKLYEQFAMTIAFAVIISTFNALTLSPALSALFLKKEKPKDNPFFKLVNTFIDWIKAVYEKVLAVVMKLRPIMVAIFLGLLMLTGLMFMILPQGFVPSEDQGYFIIAAQAPEGTSQQYMGRVIKKVETIMRKNDEVVGIFGVNGFSFTGNAANKALMFVPLTPIGERRDPSHSATAIIERVRPQLMGMTEAIVVPFEPPAIRGMGNLGGFQFHLQDRSGQAPLEQLAGLQWQLVGKANESDILTGMFATFGTNTPQLEINVDRELAESLDVPVSEIFRTLQVYLGSFYVNDFTLYNRSYRVYAQAEGEFRNSPEKLESFYVKSNYGQMLPLSVFVDVKEITGPQTISHYNLFRSTEINGTAAPGFSSGQAQQTMESLAKESLPKGLGYEWSGLFLEQSESGNASVAIFGLGLLFVYMVLAAQYENWTDPLIILLSVPLAVLGGLLALKIRGLDNDVFSQLGLVMLIGLASKNAILIVEFANQLMAEGRNKIEAAKEASLIRLRPILMTSLSFVFGVIPMVVATGAGAAARHSLGTSVFGGMLLATILSLLFVPVLYVLFKRDTHSQKA